MEVANNLTVLLVSMIKRRDVTRSCDLILAHGCTHAHTHTLKTRAPLPCNLVLGRPSVYQRGRLLRRVVTLFGSSKTSRAE